MINRHWSGVSRYSSDRIIVLIATDFPEPVVPAISRWGILARLATTGPPPISLPSASGRLMLVSPKSRAARISRSTTISRLSLGSSMPITDRPGTVDTRADSAIIDRAISSARPITRLALRPGAGSNSYMVTTGPGRTDTISPLTP